MSVKHNMNWSSMSDNSIVEKIGAFVKFHRLDQNKTQNQLAEEAGINRSTLIEFEKGMRSNIITLIQILRALKLLNVLDQFLVEEQVSPLLLAKLEQSKRKRAARTKPNIKASKSDW